MQVVYKLRNLCMLSNAHNLNVNIAIGWVLFHNVAMLNVTCLQTFQQGHYTEAVKEIAMNNHFLFHFQSLLAEMYYYGKRGLQRDLNRAVKYYQMGAHEGDPEGLYNLGVSLLRV